MRTFYKPVSECKCKLMHDKLDENLDLRFENVKIRLDGMDKALELHTQQVASRVQSKIYISGSIVGALLIILEILMTFIKK